MTLSMGLFLREASPSKRESNLCPAKTPHKSLAVVPELLASKICAGFFHPNKPLPLMRAAEFSISILTPNCLRQFKVERQSEAGDKFLASTSPSQRDPRIKAR